MTAAYSGRWRWPVEECDHDPQRRVEANDVRDGAGQLVHRIPEYCRDCGYAFRSPTGQPSDERHTDG